MKKHLFLIKIVITLGLVALIVHKIDLHVFVAEIKKIHLVPFFVAVCLLLVAWFLNTLRWKILLSTIHISISTRRLFFYNLSGVFYNIVLPSGRVTSDLAIAYQISKNHEGDMREKQKVFFATYLDRAIGLLGFLIVGSFLFMMQYSSIMYFGNFMFPVGILVALGAIVGCCALFSTMFDFLIRWLLMVPVSAARKFFETVLDVLAVCRFERRSIGKALCVSLVSVFFNFFSLYIVSVSLGAHLDFFIVSFFSALSVVLILIPVTVAGIGLREGGLIYLLVSAGVEFEKAVTISMISLFAMMTVALLGAIAELYYHFLAHANSRA